MVGSYPLLTPPLIYKLCVPALLLKFAAVDANSVTLITAQALNYQYCTAPYKLVLVCAVLILPARSIQQQDRGIQCCCKAHPE
jgi:hypothetical protein